VVEGCILAASQVGVGIGLETPCFVSAKFDAVRAGLGEVDPSKEGVVLFALEWVMWCGEGGETR
jgi:hypothetical protein